MMLNNKFIIMFLLCFLCLSFQQTYCDEPIKDRVEVSYQDTFSDHDYIQYLRMKFHDNLLMLYSLKQVCIYDINSNKKICKKIKNKMNPINDVFIYKDKVIILRDTTSEYYKLNNKLKRIKTFRFYDHKSPLYLKCLFIIGKILLQLAPPKYCAPSLFYSSKGFIYNNSFYVFRDGFDDHDYIYKIDLENYKIKNREINDIIDFEKLRRIRGCRSLFGSFHFIGENILYSDNCIIKLFSIEDLENNFNLEKYNDVISLSLNDEISIEKDINRFNIIGMTEIKGNYYILFECEIKNSRSSYYLLLDTRKKEFTFLFDEDKIWDYFTKAYLKDKYIILKSKKRTNKKGIYKTEIIDLENDMKYKFENNMIFDGVINNKFVFFNKKEKKIIVYDNIENKEYEIKFPEDIKDLHILEIIVKNNMTYILGDEEIGDKYYYKLFVLKINI